VADPHTANSRPACSASRCPCKIVYEMWHPKGDGSSTWNVRWVACCRWEVHLCGGIQMMEGGAVGIGGATQEAACRGSAVVVGIVVCGRQFGGCGFVDLPLQMQS